MPHPDRKNLFLPLLLAVCFSLPARATDTLKNHVTLRLPLTDEKLVIAHCMTNIIRYKGHRFEDSCDPGFYAPSGNVTAPLGGLTQVVPMTASYLADSTLEQAVEFEMRAAKQSGIDGFQFYYTLGNEDWDRIISAYLRVATEKNIDFKFTFCISHPSGSTESGRIAAFARRMNSILDEAGRQNPHWLRSPDGRLLLYTWYGETLADTSARGGKQNAAWFMADAYARLAQATNERFAVILSINEMISKEKLNNYLDYFPAVWMWTLPYSNDYIGQLVWSECKRRNRAFTGSAFAGFYTSKLLKRGSWDMFHTAAAAAKAGMKKTERKYIVTGLSENFRRMWEFGITRDVQIMNMITWNDYPEGHHLAPEINHNDGFSQLLLYYKALWKNQPSPFDSTDLVIAFYKKYRHAVKPLPYGIPVVEIEKPGTDPVIEDSVEVVTILPRAAQLSAGADRRIVPAGLNVERFRSVPGKVIVLLTRNGQDTTRLECPEWITAKPYRTDRITYSFSNQTVRFYSRLFPGKPLQVSAEYDPLSALNHLEFYKK